MELTSRSSSARSILVGDAVEIIEIDRIRFRAADRGTRQL
jgi:hypothetical protein